MSTRISHCGKSTENYNLCIKHGVVGFTNRGPSQGDIIYLAVKVNKDTVCGLRATLGESTDFKPWEDAERYVSCFMLEQVEYAVPFSLKFLSEIGGKYWPLKYLQGAKPIKDDDALAKIEKEFQKFRSDTSQPFLTQSANFSHLTFTDEEEDEENTISENEIADVLEAVPEEKINIMGTFQTVNFRNETDEFRGLEPLVNSNFHDLFPAYPESRTILIPENRLFISSGLEARGERSISGIKSIPDALLIVYNRQLKTPIQVNLIEYECYGEAKTRTSEKSNYMNGQIIPQVMKFASSFSIVTDRQIREETIRKWVDKTIQYIFSTNGLEEKFTSWIRELEPGLPNAMIALRMNHLLTEAFRSNLKIILMIDELSQEQRHTIKNVIEAFKLENGESVQFIAYIIRLGQKMNIVDQNAEYALSVQ